MTLEISHDQAAAAARRFVASPRVARLSLLEEYGTCAYLVELLDGDRLPASLAAAIAVVLRAFEAREETLTRSPPSNPLDQTEAELKLGDAMTFLKTLFEKEFPHHGQE